MNICDTKPFIVSVFCGRSKPASLQGFLGDFIREFNELHCNGVKWDGKIFGIKISCLICDAQARSFLKCIISPTGFSCCERCIERGVKFENRLIIIAIDAQLRDDHSFRAKTDTHHHKGETPFILLNGLDLIADFVLDPMHLIFLGVVRRMIVGIWMGPLPHCWSADEKNRFSENIMYLRQFYPFEYNRKGRILEDIKYWKATEFLSFVFYSGPLILKTILKHENYEHFLYLHCAVTILSKYSEERRIRFAEELFKFFVSEWERIYEKHQLVYNVHSLIHIADDCIKHGTLLSFSAFAFESFLGEVTSLLRGTRKPLAQLIRRLDELNNFPHDLKTKKTVWESLKPGSQQDSFCLLAKGLVV